MSKKLGRMAKSLGRRAFTLPEVLVTVALVGLLAAVVVPTVVGTMKKGDANRVAQDVTDIRGAVEQFVSDVRKYPASIGQLTNPITASLKPLQTTNTTPSTYTASDVARWKGPYLSKDSVATTSTGFGYTIQSAFVTDTFTTNLASCGACAGGAGFGPGLPSTATAFVAGKMFLTVRICATLSGVACVATAAPAVDSLAWLTIEQQIDDANAVTGSVRFRSDSGFIKILAIPIQP